MRKHIVLINVADEVDSRKICENIEDEIFNSIEEFGERLKYEELKNVESVQFHELTDFMDLVNDQQLDILTGHFISYVNFNF